jgi:dienelactone hydrolase
VNRGLRLLLWGLAGLVGAVVLGGYGLMAGWHVEDVPPAEISSLLRPHDLAFQPDSEGPFPTVLLFHGCGGLRDHNAAWGRFLADLGWASLAVDSYTGRGLAWQTVCSGRALLGPERAGDVLVTLDDARRMPWVDPQRMVLMGWSHGSYAIMDLLAMDPPKSRPTNLSEVPADSLAGVIGSVLFYPYCSFGARSPGHWSLPSPALFLLSEQDSITPIEDCIETIDALAARGLPVTKHVYPGVDHGFDAFDTRGDYESMYDEGTTQQARQRVAGFLASLAR